MEVVLSAPVDLYIRRAWYEVCRSPIDNITVDAPRTWHNIEILKDEWHRYW